MSSTPAAASSPGGVAHWNLVSISDSVFGNGDDGHLEAVDAYAAGIKRDLGIDVTVHGYWLGGYASDQILRKIGSDSALRAEIASADVIVFEVPVGEFRMECPFNNAEWHPLPERPTEWWTCAARVAARNTANANRIIDAITALRSPADALILASNLWEIGYRANLTQGIEPQMHAMYTAANAGVAAAAASHGIPVADAWTAFMGPDGKTDPVAAGLLLDDMAHLTPQGATTLAGLWRSLGYEKGRPVASSPATTPVPVAPSPVGTPAPAATSAPTPSPAPSGLVSLTNGDVTCLGLPLQPGGGTSSAARSQTLTSACTVTTDDPRVSGTETSTAWTRTMWGSLTAGAGIQSGPLRLENAGGAWIGTGSGTYSSDRGDIVAAWFKGTGGYKGLSYFELRTGTGTAAPAGSIRGLVFLGEPPDLATRPAQVTATPAPASPTPVPAPTPTAIPYGPVSVVVGTGTYTGGDAGQPTTGTGNLTRYEHANLTGLDAANDARVTGSFVASPWMFNVWGPTQDVAWSGIQWGSRPDREPRRDVGLPGLGDHGWTWRHDRVLVHGRRCVQGARVLRARPGGPFLDEFSIQGQIFPGEPPTP